MTEYADTATLGYGGSCDGRSLSQDQQVRDISHPCYMALASVIRSICDTQHPHTGIITWAGTWTASRHYQTDQIKLIIFIQLQCYG